MGTKQKLKALAFALIILIGICATEQRILTMSSAIFMLLCLGFHAIYSLQMSVTSPYAVRQTWRDKDPAPITAKPKKKNKPRKSTHTGIRTKDGALYDRIGEVCFCRLVSTSEAIIAEYIHNGNSYRVEISIFRVRQGLADRLWENPNHMPVHFYKINFDTKTIYGDITNPKIAEIVFIATLREDRRPKRLKCAKRKLGEYSIMITDKYLDRSEQEKASKYLYGEKMILNLVPKSKLADYLAGKGTLSQYIKQGKG